MIFDAHTHIFPAEVCRRRQDFFTDEPAFRLLYENPKAHLVGPEELIGAMDEEGVDAAGVLGFPWRREGLGADPTRVLAPIAEICQHYQAPLLVHTNDPLGPAYPGKAAISLPELYRAIKDLPEVDWILAHWGGGLPFSGFWEKEA